VQLHLLLLLEDAKACLAEDLLEVGLAPDLLALPWFIDVPWLSNGVQDEDEGLWSLTSRLDLFTFLEMAGSFL